MSDFEAVTARVAERVDPTAAERERLRDAADRLVERVEAALADADGDADVVRVGSTARGTWVRGDRDIDVFVRFPTDLPREDLERRGLAVGNRVLPDGHEEYAEHPYVKGTFEGYEVDLVPCYRVADATRIQSAVDRTPFHNAYLEARLTDALAADVRLFKQFLKGIGAYGSDLRTRGFSGYLTELLVLEYGGFREALSAAAGWHPPVVLDPEDHGTREFDDPLVVVDPTDPERNVAAVVAPDQVARVQHYARSLLADPAEDVFFPSEPDPLTPADVERHLARRATSALAVRFETPDLVEDQLYPQLRRSREGLVRGLEDAGFDVVRSAEWADDVAILFVELASGTLPAIERHDGPPVHVEDHATGFYEAYADADVYGPFVDGDRYVVERERETRTAVAFAEERLSEVALGARVVSIVEAGEYDVLADEDVAVLAESFGTEFARYFDPKP